MSPNPDRRPAKQSTILVVDDDREICTFLDELLTMDGFGVSVAYGYEGALREARKNTYDLALIDFLYPAEPRPLDGVDVLHAVRRFSPNVRAFLMTGLAGNVPIDPIVTQGFSGFLSKPFSVTAIRNLLSG